jgi:hypothetical protein
MHDQYGKVIVSLSRDYLGAITDVERRDAQGRRLPGATDAELAALEVLAPHVERGWGIIMLNKHHFCSNGPTTVDFRLHFEVGNFGGLNFICCCVVLCCAMLIYCCCTQQPPHFQHQPLQVREENLFKEETWLEALLDVRHARACHAPARPPARMYALPCIYIALQCTTYQDLVTLLLLLLLSHCCCCCCCCCHTAAAAAAVTLLLLLLLLAVVPAYRAAHS